MPQYASDGAFLYPDGCREVCFSLLRYPYNSPVPTWARDGFTCESSAIYVPNSQSWTMYEFLLAVREEASRCPRLEWCKDVPISWMSATLHGVELPLEGAVPDNTDINYKDRMVVTVHEGRVVQECESLVSLPLFLLKTRPALIAERADQMMLPLLQVK